jgi:hypothetical protein
VRKKQSFLELRLVQNRTITDTALNDYSPNPVRNWVINIALSKKVDKVAGKGLSTEDYTSEEKTKLSGIETGANKTIVDTALSDTSTNPVQNQVINSALSGKVDKVTGKGLSTEDYTTTEKTKLSGIETGANKTIVDSALSDTSTNPVQNKVIKENLDDKYPKAWDVELSQAQYDALPASKYVDGKCYWISDGDVEDPIIYGFHVDPDESDPSDAVTYLMDAVGMEPARMGTTAFNYGSWKNAFFMPKPCMLKYDGTVDYYLDPNDYTKKVDGTPSDIADYAYQGNVMIEFPKMYYKFESGNAVGEGYFYVSDQKVDDSYKCWCYLDADGNETEHFYMAAYNGVIYDNKMRSLSGKKLSTWSTTAYSSSATYAVDDVVNNDGKMWKCITAVETAEEFDPTKWEQFEFNGQTTGTEETNYAKANNTTEKVEWYINVLCDRMLINGLLVLISKSLDTQGAFGRGIETGSQTAKEAYVTGSLNDKGLFYGSSGSSTAVKVFGMENWWGCTWRRTAGLIGVANNIYKYKMTYGTSDGSTANGYNTNGSGYLSIGNKPTTNGYTKKMQYGLWGCLPIETGSYSTQYFSDYWYDGTGYARFGGSASLGAYDGAFCLYLINASGGRNWSISSDLSCKPCANNQS